jgi:hypothetical protein
MFAISTDSMAEGRRTDYGDLPRYDRFSYLSLVSL